MLATLIFGSWWYCYAAELRRMEIHWNAPVFTLKFVTKIIRYIFTVIVLLLVIIEYLHRNYDKDCIILFGSRVVELVGTRNTSSCWCVRWQAWDLQKRLFLCSVRGHPDGVFVGAAALRWQFITFPLGSWIVMSNMMLQTIRKPVKATIISSARQGLFFIPLIFILPHYLGCRVWKCVRLLLTFLRSFLPYRWHAVYWMKWNESRRNSCKSEPISYGEERSEIYLETDSFNTGWLDRVI